MYEQVINLDEMRFEWEYEVNGHMIIKDLHELKEFQPKIRQSSTVLLMIGGNGHNFPGIVIFPETKGIILNQIERKAYFV